MIYTILEFKDMMGALDDIHLAAEAYLYEIGFD